MFTWDNKYRFIFSDLGASDKVGVNDVGIGVFKKKPYIGLTKEILQNSTDAPDINLPVGTPVRVRFELVYIDRDDIPDVDRLNSVIHKCYEYYPNGDDGVKLKTIQDAADRYLAQPGKVPVLKISDYNTTGLCGVLDEKGSKWSGLVRERSATNKTGVLVDLLVLVNLRHLLFLLYELFFTQPKRLIMKLPFRGRHCSPLLKKIMS